MKWKLILLFIAIIAINSTRLRQEKKDERKIISFNNK